MPVTACFRQMTPPPDRPLAKDPAHRTVAMSEVADQNCGICAGPIRFDELFALGPTGKAHLSCHFRRPPAERLAS